LGKHKPGDRCRDRCTGTHVVLVLWLLGVPPFLLPCFCVERGSMLSVSGFWWWSWGRGDLGGIVGVQKMIRLWWVCVWWVGVVGRWWVTWSRVYRWLWCRRYRHEVLRSRSLVEAQADMNLVAYVGDGWRALGDSVGTARRFVHWVRVAKLRGCMADDPLVPPYDNDCDDHAAYGVGVCDGAVYLQVAYMRTDMPRRMGGHVVCLARRSFDHVGVRPPVGWRSGVAPLWHIGNWGLHGPFADLEGAVRSVTQGRDMIGWALLDGRLRLLAHGRSWASTRVHQVDLT